MLYQALQRAESEIAILTIGRWFIGLIGYQIKFTYLQPVPKHSPYHSGVIKTRYSRVMLFQSLIHAQRQWIPSSPYIIKITLETKPQSNPRASEHSPNSFQVHACLLLCSMVVYSKLNVTSWPLSCMCAHQYLEFWGKLFWSLLSLANRWYEVKICTMYSFK